MAPPLGRLVSTKLNVSQVIKAATRKATQAPSAGRLLRYKFSKLPRCYETRSTCMFLTQTVAIFAHMRGADFHVSDWQHEYLTIECQ